MQTLGLRTLRSLKESIAKIADITTLRSLNEWIAMIADIRTLKKRVSKE